MKVFGIEVRIDPSWLIIATLVSYSLFFWVTATYEYAGVIPAVAISLFGAALFFGSVLVHELTHAVVARRRGFAIKDITLFLFGGATQTNIDSKGPVDELVVSIVGPLASFGLVIVFAVLRALALPVADGALAGTLGYLAWANLLLGAFNLLPGLPLDGGRVLRAALWKSTGDLERSTKIASDAGQVIGYALMAFGALTFFAGALVGGIWLAAIGWFLALSARASYSQTRMRDLFERVEALDVMETEPMSIPAGTPITMAVHEYLLRHDHDAFVVEYDGRVIGTMTLESVRKVPRAEWNSRTVEDVMTRLTFDGIVDPHAPLVAVIPRLDDAAETVAVGYPGNVVGVITRWDVTEWIRRRRLLAA